MKKLLLVAALLTAVALVPQTASADPFNIRITSEIGQAVTVYASGGAWGTGGISTTAGAFLVTGELGSFQAYCVDLQHYISAPGDYVVNPLGIMSTWHSVLGNDYSTDLSGSQAAWLYNTYAGAAAAAGSYANAGLQLAIWEVLYDTGKNISSGLGFHATGVSTEAAAFAAAALAALPVQGPYGEADWLRTSAVTGRDTQDLIARVPEPATLSLLGLGLVAIARVVRRKKA